MAEFDYGVSDTPYYSGTYAIDFADTVDITDEGADPTGTRPCNHALRAALAPDTLVEFPDGEYFFAPESFALPSDVAVGVRGLGDATIRFPRGTRREWLRTGSGANAPTGLLVANLTIDQTASNCAVGLRCNAQERGTIRNVTYEGRGIHEQGGGTRFAVAATTADGVFLLRNCAAHRGSVMDRYLDGRGATAVSIGPEHRGEFVGSRNDFREFGNGAYLAGATPGDVRIENNLLVNNNIADVLCGGDTAEVVETMLRVDLDAYSGEFEDTGPLATNGVVVAQDLTRSAERDPAPMVRRCRFQWGQNPPAAASTPVIVQQNGRGVRLRDCVIRHDGRGHGAVVAKEHVERDGSLVSAPREVDVRGLTVGGRLSDARTVRLTDIGNAQLRDVCIGLPGVDVDGVEFEGGTDGHVSASVIDVSGEQFVGDVPHSDILGAGSCGRTVETAGP